MITTTLHELIHLVGPNDSQAAQLVFDKGYKSGMKPPSLQDFLNNRKYKTRGEAINAFEMESSYYWAAVLRAKCGLTPEEAVNLP
jgi:hypothetical protein